MTIPSLGEARLVRLRLSQHAQRDAVLALREVMGQIPEASELSPGTLVAMKGELELEQRRGLLDRLARMRPRGQAHRATLCTCLLARGYVRIGAARDEHGVEWSWGYAPQATGAEGQRG